MKNVIIRDDNWQTQFHVTPELREIFRELKIFIVNFRPEITIRAGVRISPYTNWEHAGTLNTMGFATYHMGGSTELEIGNYCSIAGGIGVLGERHPIEYASQSSLNYDNGKAHFAAIIRDYQLHWNKVEPLKAAYGELPIIGHDVWTGVNVTLARNITIGSGSIVAAHSVVTKSIEPYMIMGGNPAKPIRQRFSDRIVERMLQAQWWNYANVFGTFDMRDPERFLGAFEEQLGAGCLVSTPNTMITREVLKSAIAEKLQQAI
jgi:acetyltransferase-like isoleucine patch superfamily enzyme